MTHKGNPMLSSAGNVFVIVCKIIRFLLKYTNICVFFFHFDIFIFVYNYADALQSKLDFFLFVITALHGTNPADFVHAKYACIYTVLHASQTIMIACLITSSFLNRQNPNSNLNLQTKSSK